MNNTRNFSIDIIKICACFFVMLLHIFQPSANYSSVNIIYLIGTFGVPLFFTANGFLLYNRELSFQYCFNKALKLVKFMIPWIVIIGTLVCIKEKSWGGGGYWTTILGVCNCSGYLYHFWFLLALIIIYIFIATLNWLCKKCVHKSIQSIINIKALVFILCLMECVQIANVLLVLNGYSAIRQIVWPEFRIVTNLGYFMIGMIISKEKERFLTTAGNKGLLFFIVSVVYVEIMDCFVLHFTWASSYYDSIFIVTGVIGLFLFFVEHNFQREADKVVLFAQFTMPAYILHPLMKMVMDQIGKSIALSGIMLSFIELIFVILTIPILTYVLNKTNLKFLIKL